MVSLSRTISLGLLLAALGLVFGPSQPVEQVSTQAAYQRQNEQDREEVREEAAYWTGMIQAGVGVFGLIGLFATVIYARRAWMAARASAEADNEALKLTREAMVSERRPWVSITIQSVSIVIGDNGDDSAIVVFRVTNVGRHPATSVAISGEGVTEDEKYKLSVPDRLIAEDREMEATFGRMIGIGVSLFPDEPATIDRSYSVRRQSAYGGTLLAGYVSYCSSLTDQTHYTPWAFEIRYAGGGRSGITRKGEAIKYYLTTSPT